MRAFLRADPDVIMVGEMRDAETAKIGVEASLTGHLVFSTLHTNSAVESVVRLLDIGMDSFNFSDALLGILGQRLARRLCSKCKRPHPASEAEISALAGEYCGETRLDRDEVLEQWQRDYAVNGCVMLHEAVGCQACRNGYAGRAGIYELLVATPRLKDLIRSRASVPQLVDEACKGGMRLLRQDAIDKVLQGVLDLSGGAGGLELARSGKHPSGPSLRSTPLPYRASPGTSPDSLQRLQSLGHRTDWLRQSRPSPVG